MKREAPPPPSWAAPVAGQQPPPSALDREARVRLIGEFAQTLLAGRKPSRDAELFVAAALLGWLEQGQKIGDLERDFLQVSKPSSRITGPEIWRRQRQHR